MAKLILSMDGLVLKEIPLVKERMTVGRKAHNDIQIDNMAISGEHAAVVTILSDSFLEDLNSTNGTLVNGQPVKKHFLKGRRRHRAWQIQDEISCRTGSLGRGLGLQRYGGRRVHSGARACAWR
jgi:pSer/pThr/pTyr-binding forkhead associated (FHA) protein